MQYGMRNIPRSFSEMVDYAIAADVDRPADIGAPSPIRRVLAAMAPRQSDDGGGGLPRGPW